MAGMEWPLYPDTLHGSKRVVACRSSPTKASPGRGSWQTLDQTATIAWKRSVGV